MNNVDVCIYHKGCLDGFMSAYLVYLLYPEAEFIAATYGDDPPDDNALLDKDILIVDFSYSRDILERLFTHVVGDILVLDHHKTAEENLKGLPFAKFDMNKSGCQMVWDYFNSKVLDIDNVDTIRLLCSYVADRDLWKFNLHYTREICAALYSYDFDFKIWDWLITQRFDVLLDEGLALLRQREKLVKSLCKGWVIRYVQFGDYEIPILNCPRWLASDVLNFLAKDRLFAVSYFDIKDKRLYELRSSKSGADVSKIAKRFGGGGHRYAAGFSTDLEILPDSIFISSTPDG